ncbi:PP2C family protein-serine/threonine phosphatase [Conexibacter sp. JD483]|uniref:PP2C family protein-serine/threonine phosphatase n=1 Tax=unclassified Conexibacter TaxID=2627773 RepID=UPI0027267E30|nr:MULTISPECIES: PP2C family protein-serine/threonine phosphatase [unclassified Conexibacter]MDO8188144.1 PP2C family protein-serine/threonine phosphatase [Conexibacter sp. CPCC 205706]MDO8201292.1 PP2C family protein-serine/threonine phosphatase [Conexibacter sp. CPCC 205762]MDR9370436.1 PP2C family protein-serine/threonine phosphatase [Conexibacter sp. JD483]
MSRISERTANESRAPLGRALMLDTASEPFFGRLLRFAAEQLGVPIAFLAIPSDGEQQVKAGCGLPAAVRRLQRTAVPQRLEVVADTGGQPALVAGVAIGAYVALPLHGRDDDPIATFYLADRDPRDWAAGELRRARDYGELIEEAVRARRAALALGADQDRERDVAARRHRAETDAHRQHAQESAAVEQLSARLQRALLPARLDADLDARVTVLYEPGSERLLLGGDFLDVRLLSGGRVAFVLGDVCGHGPEAAALAVALRASWNALQDDDHSLETVADRLGHTVEREQPGQSLFATALLGVLDDRSGVATMLSAGHPMPIAIDGDARPLELPRGLPLGLAADHPAPWTAATVQLGERSLLAYTDGLVEGRLTPGTAARLGEDGLLTAIAQALEAQTPPRALARRLLDHATRAHGSPLPDDVAVLQLFPRAR